MKELCIHHHLGLGDHFDMNGMVRNYLKEFNKIYVFSKSSYYSMIEYMYRDNDNIIVIEIPNERMNEEVQIAENFYNISSNITNFLRIGFEHYPFLQENQLDKNCWEFFYEQVNVPYNIRTDMFHVERDMEEENRVLKKLNPSGDKFIFVHDDKERGFSVNKEHILDKGLTVIENDMDDNIFHFLKIIENAEEIHCMESSFKSLIDIYAKTENIFYHDFRNQPLGTKTNKKWKVIKYE